LPKIDSATVSISIFLNYKGKLKTTVMDFFST